MINVSLFKKRGFSVRSKGKLSQHSTISEETKGITERLTKLYLTQTSLTT